MTKIKICGITNERDALGAVNLGVDALGFIFAESPRRVSPQKVKKIVSLLPPFISLVGVFVNEDKKKVEEIARYCSLTHLQFHGEESPSYCQQFKERVIKAFRMKGEETLREISQYKGVSAYLLDTYSLKKRGGTGELFDWKLAQKVKKRGVPIILAGGLNSENVDKAIAKVRPYAVDTSSGVERKEGEKDFQKMREFVRRVRKQDEIF
ncbi:phosphoribosylanthranilate isomerase [Candidatus Aerophobetes bacterium]|nr:phosphoribosylanthranilate isomerase [Candidatus Aerophobetes bacterium]